MKSLDEIFPSHPTIEDLISIGNPSGHFYADTGFGYFITMDFLYDFDLKDNQARIVTITPENGKYSIGSLETKPLRENGDFVYWVKEFRLVLPRDLPQELQPLAKELLERYNISNNKIGD